MPVLVGFHFHWEPIRGLSDAVLVWRRPGQVGRQAPPLPLAELLLPVGSRCAKHTRNSLTQLSAALFQADSANNLTVPVAVACVDVPVVSSCGGRLCSLECISLVTAPVQFEWNGNLKRPCRCRFGREFTVNTEKWIPIVSGVRDREGITRAND